MEVRYIYRYIDKVALVTGASSGIGYSIAEKLTELGLQVVGVARRVDNIEKLSKKLEGKLGKLHALKCDASSNEDIHRVFQWIKENLGKVHILINNAGILRISSFIDAKTEDLRQTLNVNVLALALFTQLYLKQAQVEDFQGHIININSTVGLNVPNYGQSVLNIYPPSKFAVTALTEVVRQELIQNKSKIKITSIHPGATGTEGLEETGLAATMKLIRPEDVTSTVVYSLSTPPDVQIQQIIVRPVEELQ